MLKYYLYNYKFELKPGVELLLYFRARRISL